MDTKYLKTIFYRFVRRCRLKKLKEMEHSVNLTLIRKMVGMAARQLVLQQMQEEDLVSSTETPRSTASAATPATSPDVKMEVKAEPTVTAARASVGFQPRLTLLSHRPRLTPHGMGLRVESK